MKTTRVLSLNLTPASFALPVQLFIALGGAIYPLPPFSGGIEGQAIARQMPLLAASCDQNEDKECDHHRGSSEERSQRDSLWIFSLRYLL